VSTDKSKTVVRRQLLKGAAAVGAVAALQATQFAQASDTDAAGPSLVGTWMFQIDDANSGKSMDLTSFSQDGLVIDAGSVPLKAPPAGQGGPSSVSLGRWAAAMGGGYNVTFVSLAPGQNGALQGIVTINAHLTVGAGGDTASGSFTVTGKAGSKVMFSTKGTVKGTRIKASAM
jgi:hypothetical protein